MTAATNIKHIKQKIDLETHFTAKFMEKCLVEVCKTLDKEQFDIMIYIIYDLH